MRTTQDIRPLRSQGFTLIELLVVISIIAILAGFALPVFSSAQKRGRIADSLNQCKQLGTAMRMYSGDNDGNFPSLKTDGTPLVDANDAYENLMPKYSTAKTIFEVKTSFYCKGARVAGETPTSTYQLLTGNNDYNYITGMTESSDSRWPIGCTGTTAATVTYTNDITLGGGVWSGTEAVVVYVDGSARVNQCNGGSTGASFVKRPDSSGLNILIVDTTPTAPWLGSTSVVLLPR